MNQELLPHVNSLFAVEKSIATKYKSFLKSCKKVRLSNIFKSILFYLHTFFSN